MKDLFYGITEKQKEKILVALEARHLLFNKDSIIIDNLRMYNYFGLIEEGTVQIVRTDLAGNQLIISELEDNSIFHSYLSSLSSNEYSLYAKTDCRIVIIDFKNIMNLKEKGSYYEQFYRNIIFTLLEQSGEANERIEILVNKTIREKLLTYFKINYRKTLSKVIYIPYTYTELADYLGVNRSALSRELNMLKNEGFIEINRHKIKLLYII